MKLTASSRYVSAILLLFITACAYENEDIYDVESEDESDKFSSYNFTIQPGVSVIRKFGRIGIEAQAGYHGCRRT